tara:strand:+ start:5920 stop:6120 length:201 start_codon:yes stop_codon:yes gene_type:complete
MPCKKTDLISAINSFGAARASGDNTLLAFSVNLVQSLIDTLDFEGEIEVTTAEVEDKSKTKKQGKE